MQKSCNTVAEKPHSSSVATKLQEVLPTFAAEIKTKREKICHTNIITTITVNITTTIMVTTIIMLCLTP